MPNALHQPFHGREHRLHDRLRRQLDAEEADHHQQVAQRIYREAPREAESIDDDRRQARASDAREIESARIQGDRVDDIVAPDQLHHQRLARRNVEGARDAAQERDPDQYRDRDVPRPVEPPEERRFEEQHPLRDAHEHELVAPVRDHPGVERQQ
jgi:hypothetical protein